MRRLGDLAPAETARTLAGPGLTLGIGPFDVRFRADAPEFLDTFRRFYADFPLRPEPAVVDFRISVLRRLGWRGWRLDGRIDGNGHTQLAETRHAPLLAEWLLNWCVALRANRHLTLHAAVAECGGAAVVLPAPPGSGKSTLCAALVACGWRLLSDELALLRPEDGGIDPLPRPLPLKEGSIAAIRAFAPHLRLGPRFRGTAKGDVVHVLPPAQAVNRQDEPARPAWILFPRWQAGAPPALTPVPPAETFALLVGNAMNYEVMGLDGFRALDRLVRTCAAHRFVYGDLDDAVGMLDALARAGTGGRPADAVVAGG